MNKRQKKKNYKKVHTYNLPSTKSIERKRKRAGQAEKSLIKQAEKTAKRILFMKKEIERKIQEMPEKEFQGILKKLSLEQQALVRNMRYKAREE